MCALTSGDLHHALRHMQTIFITQIYDGYGTVIVESTDVRDQSARRGLLSHVGSHREDVSRETVLLQAFKEEGDKGNIRAVRYLSGSATARKHTSNSTPAIDDSCTRVSTFRERPRLKRARQHRNLPRLFTRLFLEGIAFDRTDVVQTSDSKSGSAATLEDHDGRVTPFVNLLGVRFAHLVIR